MHIKLIQTGTKGFTLLEIIVAMFILAVGFVVIMEVFSIGIRSAKESSDYSYGLLLAYQKMGELELNNTILPSTTSTNGIFEHTHYKWELEIKPFPFTPNPESKIIPRIYETKIRITWEGNDTNGVEISTLRTTF